MEPFRLGRGGRLLIIGLLGWAIAAGLFLLKVEAIATAPTHRISAAAVVSVAAVADYPPNQLPPTHYLPVATWSGRLILPDHASAEVDQQDWVWLEVYTSPLPQLIGQRLRLQWQPDANIQPALELVTQDIEFDAAAIASIDAGHVHPTRLNGWSQVGPLQSLAGTRPQDDMLMALPAAVVSGEGAAAVIRIDAMPMQIPERFYGLVKILGPDVDYPAPAACPGQQPCLSDYLRVRHYNPVTQDFDGAIETVHIPQVPVDRNGIFQSTPQGLADSPAGTAGWYVYGAPNREGLFVVQAIAPRRLFQLQPDEVINAPQAALNYVNFGNWDATPSRKGQTQSVLLAADGATEPLTTWPVDEQMLVIHLFGGIGGEQAEPRSLPGTVTGHFSYGIGSVIRDPFTQELQLQIIYDQVYAHGPQGIVSGRTLWAEYTGNLQRGWLGVRPISDVLVKIPALSHTYQFGNTTLTPFAEFQRELLIMMARYRTGDGTGAAIVTPARSCIQDSSQALYETIRVISHQVAAPEVAAWLADHPDDPQTLLLQNLIDLGQQLQQQLVPLGIARADWNANSDRVAGTRPGETRDRDSGDRVSTAVAYLRSIMSWRTVIPRVAHDSIAAILLDHGAELWFLRTNQVGGQDPTILPLAPTELFGDYVVIPTAFSRLIESLRWLRWSDLGWFMSGIAGYAIVLNLGRFNAKLPVVTLANSSFVSVRAGLLLPALLEELGFRVLLLPHPTEAVLPVTRVIWTGVSLGLFVLYYGWRNRQRQAVARASWLDRWRNWGTVITLGLVTTVLYLTTGSLWVVTGFHWAVLADEPVIYLRPQAPPTE
ncbi:MAG: type II CAAX prenyl endopeptidase Rce1 family protein [Leptolyngbyaceae cyanobacterium]